jgi:hypothetical protein
VFSEIAQITHVSFAPFGTPSRDPDGSPIFEVGEFRPLRCYCLEPEPWTDPRTGRTGPGPIRYVTHDMAEAESLSVGIRGRLHALYQSREREFPVDFGVVEVAYNRPVATAGEATRWVIVFDPVGK